MRIFVAGASGVIGIRLVPLLVEGGHDVAGMTRSSAKTEQLRTLGAEPIVCDVFDAAALRAAVVNYRPDAIIHELTDLPDREADLPTYGGRNRQIRTVGTQNLVDAAAAAGTQRFLAESIAWRPAGEGTGADELEAIVLGIGGVVIRYGQLYGPGTYYEHDLPGHPRVHVDTAARATVGLLDAPTGIVTVVDEE